MIIGENLRMSLSSKDYSVEVEADAEDDGTEKDKEVEESGITSY